MPTVTSKFWFLSSQWVASTAGAAATGPDLTVTAGMTQASPVLGWLSSGQVYLWVPMTNSFRALPMVTT